ncbi:hypothetical protein AB4K20DRAFT_1870462 [Rhizopus microsporus]
MCIELLPRLKSTTVIMNLSAYSSWPGLTRTEIDSKKKVPLKRYKSIPMRKVGLSSDLSKKAIVNSLEKRISKDAKRLFRVLIATMTTFFRLAIDHQNKALIKVTRPSQAACKNPFTLTGVPLGYALAEPCQLSNSLMCPTAPARQHRQTICHCCDLR